MPGCTDGVALHNMVRYFKCPPSRAYFCLLSCLVDEQSFLLEQMGGSRKIHFMMLVYAILRIYLFIQILYGMLIC